MHQRLLLFCLITVALAMPQGVRAQYILPGQRAGATYVDLIPDKTVAAQRPGTTEAKDSLDLDADGRYDLRINAVVSTVNFPSFSESRVMPLHDNVSIYSSSQAPAILRFAGNDTIQQRIPQPNPPLPPNAWGSRSTIYAYGPSWLTRAGNNPAGIQSFGYWLDGQDGYLGIRLRSSTTGSWRYGWVRIQAITNSTNSTTIVVKDYALANLALAQRTASAAGWQVAPIPATAWVTVKPPTPTSGQITVVDALGKVHLSGSFSPTNARFDISGLAAGVYFMQIKTTREAFLERMVKE
ncbi:T9SS type A sorting domain-containing protein [Hymenobacter properus]|uniref:T9SS type A sorting domain-containing protein n=1 Tax=Hymenobacter properus TaxID=2791026 RepID=A0A931FK32_9BACT|nr:T9SS type A sorting domain-containing protein [Hymenobacter properus]MBF9143562.1 T9SS type A sorting domain-containing protein [Hymenobacter properus]MBR7722375.1 T9SS type A sorting domain-containing protein [Microvirga sp. SRT04]